MLHLLKLCIFAFFWVQARSWDVARTPPMGFNTWNLFGCGVNADILERTADALVKSG